MFGAESRQADAGAANAESRHDGGDDASFELANEVDPMDATDDLEDASGEAADASYEDVSDDDVQDDDVQDDDVEGDAGYDTEQYEDDEDDEVGDVGSDAEVPFEPAFDERPVPEAPATGDTAIDEAMTELAVAQAGSFEARIEAGERAHRLLQGRLGGLGEA